MFPDLQHNDLIVVRRVDFYTLQVGDVITFNSTTSINGRVQDIVITHQIIDYTFHPITNEKAFITSGTNQNVPQDARLLTKHGVENTNSFIGIVSFTSRALGNIIAYLASPFGITMIVINVGAVFLFFVFFVEKKVIQIKTQ